MAHTAEERLTMDAVKAIQTGDLETLRRLLSEHPDLVGARVGPRTLLHVATDWPGHFPNGPRTVSVLIDAGANVNARFTGQHTETPLHWAASSDDVDVIDVLIDAGADREAPGSLITGGTPLADAVAFGRWRAARRLIEHGARTTLWQAAALGLTDRVEQCLADDASPPQEEITNAFWCSCHGGQRGSAEYRLDKGADLNWVGHDRLTPLDAARRGGADDLVRWLEGRGARSAGDPG